jgi:hypothetical protein
MSSAAVTNLAFRAVIGDNASGPDGHHTGFNGIWSLVPTGTTTNVIGAGLAGLNLEHYINGRDEDGKKPDILFDPRRSPIKLRRRSASSVLLHQPPTAFYGVESWTEFTIQEPNTIEMAFRCIPRKDIFPNGWLGVFWATYVKPQEEPHANFLGYESPEQVEPTWLQTDGYSMVYSREAKVPLKFPGPFQGHAMATTDERRWAEPFYYCLWGEYAYIVMFETDHDIGMYAGYNRPPASWNPWDFQMIIHEPEIGSEYGLKVRIVFDKFEGRDGVLAQVRKWKRDLLRTPSKRPPR